MKNTHTYSLRFALIPGTDLQPRIKRLTEFCKAAQIDDVMFFISAESHNNGHLTKDMAKPYLKAIGLARDELSKIGVTTSLNPWVTLLHTERGRKLHSGQNFDLMTDPDGRQANTIVCPLSESWRVYYFDYIKYLCDEIKPLRIWLEDDLRLHNHDPLSFGGCFCDKHMKLYAARLNKTSISRSEFVEGMIKGKKGYREAYSSVNGEVMNELLTLITETLKESGTKIGLMTSSGNVYRFEGRNQFENFKTVSKYQPAVNRVSLGNYRETSTQRYGYSFNRHLISNRANLPDNLDLYAEIENAPMSRYSKSVRWTMFQILVSQPYLMAGTTLDIFGFEGNGVIDDNRWINALKGIKPYLNALIELGLKYSDAEGITAFSGNKGHLFKRNCKRLSDIVDYDNWLGGTLAYFGASVKYVNNPDISKQIVALSASTINEFDEAWLKALFSDNYVILNAQSIAALEHKNLLHLVGISSISRMHEETESFSYEQVAAEGFTDYVDERADAQVFVGDMARIEYESEPTVLTKIYDFKDNFAANGITMTDRVLILPYYEDEMQYDFGMPYGLLQPLRRKVIQYALRNISLLRRPVIADECLLVPYTFEKNGKTYIMLSNFTADVVDNVRLFMGIDYTKARLLTVDNPIWNDISFTVNSDAYEFDFSVPSAGVSVLEMTK